MSRFADQAQRILETASSAAANGQLCSPITILIGSEGTLEMISESDWPLDSLLRERSAKSAYRISQRQGRICVEGRDGPSRCWLEQETTAAVAKRLLGSPIAIASRNLLL